MNLQEGMIIKNIQYIKLTHSKTFTSVCVNVFDNIYIGLV